MKWMRTSFSPTVPRSRLERRHEVGALALKLNPMPFVAHKIAVK